MTRHVRRFRRLTTIVVQLLLVHATFTGAVRQGQCPFGDGSSHETGHAMVRTSAHHDAPTSPTPHRHSADRCDDMKCVQTYCQSAGCWTAPAVPSSTSAATVSVSGAAIVSDDADAVPNTATQPEPPPPRA